MNIGRTHSQDSLVANPCVSSPVALFQILPLFASL